MAACISIRSHYVIGVLILLCCPAVQCHGWLKYPPSRGALRNFGFENEPENYDVHGQNCGGKDRQWRKNGGKCGVCGDPYDAFPRQNEAPDGRYATGTIVKSYNQGGQLQAEVVMTWGHRGWMEFRLCPVNNKNKPATQSCLDRYLLKRSGSSQTRMMVEAFGRLESITVELDLPRDLSCAQCVLQWKYHTGKDWGCEPTRGCGLGFGPQEEFYGCADIAIDPVISLPPSTTTTTTTSTKFAPTNPTTTTPTTTTTTTTTTTSAPRTTRIPTRRTTGLASKRTTKSKAEIDAMVWACRSHRTSQNGLFYDNWCRGNCLRQFCPPSLCNGACQDLKPYTKLSRRTS